MAELQRLGIEFDVSDYNAAQRQQMEQQQQQQQGEEQDDKGDGYSDSKNGEYADAGAGAKDGAFDRSFTPSRRLSLDPRLNKKYMDSVVDADGKTSPTPEITVDSEGLRMNIMRWQLHRAANHQGKSSARLKERVICHYARPWSLL